MGEKDAVFEKDQAKGREKREASKKKKGPCRSGLYK